MHEDESLHMKCEDESRAEAVHVTGSADLSFLSLDGCRIFKLLWFNASKAAASFFYTLIQKLF